MAPKKDKKGVSIDPAGVTPGVAAQPLPPKKTVALKCRISGCEGSTAIEVIGGSQGGESASHRVYQCTECQGTWGLPVGGFFPY